MLDHSKLWLDQRHHHTTQDKARHGKKRDNGTGTDDYKTKQSQEKGQTRQNKKREQVKDGRLMQRTTKTKDKTRQDKGNEEGKATDTRTKNQHNENEKATTTTDNDHEQDKDRQTADKDTHRANLLTKTLSFMLSTHYPFHSNCPFVFCLVLSFVLSSCPFVLFVLSSCLVCVACGLAWYFL